MKRIFLKTLTVFMFSSLAMAREEHRFYSSVRCQAMGNACIGVVNDETALIINPAGLGKLRDFYGTLVDPEVEINSSTSNIYNSNTSLKPFDLSSVKSGLDQNLGSPYHAKMQVFPSFVARNFGVGFLGKYSLDAMENAAGTTIDTFYRNDYAFILGYNLRLLDGRVKIGVNTKLISRIEVDNSSLSASGPLDYPTIASEGVGLSTDVGLILTAPWTYLPSISAVVRDVGGTTFDKASGIRMTTTNRPNSIKQDIDVAVALFPIHTNRIRSSWTLQYDGLLTMSQQSDKAKRLHGGMEFNFGDIFFLRAGYNQRYWTAGFELASESFQFQITSYGEEIGDENAPLEDRRYTTKFAWRF